MKTKYFDNNTANALIKAFYKTYKANLPKRKNEKRVTARMIPEVFPDRLKTPPVELVKMLLLIPKKMIYSKAYIQWPQYHESMLFDAEVDIMIALHRKQYKPKNKNAMAYFSSVAAHAFLKVIKRETRHGEHHKAISYMDNGDMDALMQTDKATDELEF